MISLAKRATAPFEKRFSLKDFDGFLDDQMAWFLGASGGSVVNPETALGISAVYNAVTIIAQTCGWLPFKLFEDLPNGGKEPATNHPLYNVLFRKPNRWQTAMEWREMMTGHVVLRGNAYSQIVAKRGGIVRELVPLHPDRMRVFVRDNGDIVYKYKRDDGTERTFLSDHIFHLKGLSSDGVVGLSVLSVARKSFEMSIRLGDYGAKTFKNSVRPSGALKHQGQLSETAQKNLRESFLETYGGNDNAGKPLILEEGMEWVQMGLTNADAEFLGSRKHEVSEVARWFNIPPHMLKDLERATFSNIEEQSIDFVTHTMMPWFSRWEQRVDTDLLGNGSTYAKFVTQALLRGNSKMRGDFYRMRFNTSSITPNQIRMLEDENPSDEEGADELWAPVNMVPMSMAREVAEASDETQPPGPTDGTVNDGDRSLFLRIQKGFRPIFRAELEKLDRKEARTVAGLQRKHENDPDLLEKSLEIARKEQKQRFMVSMIPILTDYAESLNMIRTVSTPDDLLTSYVRQVAESLTGVENVSVDQVMRNMENVLGWSTS